MIPAQRNSFSFLSLGGGLTRSHLHRKSAAVNYWRQMIGLLLLMAV